MLNNEDSLRFEINEYADLDFDEFIALRGGLKGIRKNRGH
jgi:C1A family cysteine protease